MINCYTNNITTKLAGLLAAAACLLIVSCRKFVEIGIPKNQTTTAAVYNSDVTAVSAVTGIYSEMIRTGIFAGGGDGSVGMLAGLSADEFVGYFASDGVSFQQNNLLATNSVVKTALWEAAYKHIYYANAALEGLTNADKLTDSVKQQLIGEVKFVRAFCYFYLVNLFGEVPLASSTDYAVNNVLPRSDVETVYDQVISDLIDAQNALPGSYTSLYSERIRPTKWAPTALLARVYLFRKGWANAISQSSALIENSTLFYLESNLNNIFINTSAETIWQLKPVEPGKNTHDAGIYILTGDLPGYVTLTDTLLNSFESADSRKNEWISSTTNPIGVTFNFPYKYKIVEQNLPVTEYSVVFRLAEQYLIRAEARAEQGLLPDAMADLDMIRNRAGLPLIQDTNPGISKEELLDMIAHERKVELFSEWGHRWFDLKRTDRANAVLAPIKGVSWQPEDVLYPIPQSERDNNLNLSQNPGYL